MANAEEIKSLLPSRHARDIKVFGSVARSEDRADSDVDFLVDFVPGASILDQVHLEMTSDVSLEFQSMSFPLGA
jgi:predicted nucleotidyltransferase